MSKIELEHFNDLISSIKMGLSHFTLTETPTDTEYQKSFYIDELQKSFNICRTLTGPLKTTILHYDGYHISMTRNDENKLCSKRTISTVEEQYEIFLYINSKKFKRFIKKTETIIGRKVELIDYDILPIRLILLQLTEDIILSIMAPQGTDSTLFNFKSKEKNLATQHKTQKSLFEHLKLLNK